MDHPDQQDLYVDDPRAEVGPHVPRAARSVLDVGCGRGGFGLTLRDVLGSQARLVAVEPVASQATLARVGHGYDEVYTGYFPDALADSGERFDLVTFNDVLEHVIDPAVLLAAAIERLHPSGWVLATIPNVRFLPVVLDLVRRDRWDYADWGVLDRTHLRFFTRSTMVELLESAGLVDVRAAGVNSVFGLSRFRRYRPLAGRIGSAEFMQYVVVGRRA